MNTACASMNGLGPKSSLPFGLPLAVPGRGPIEAQLEELKARLLRPIMSSVASQALAREVQGAANEAAALAWYTAYPILVLPALLEERVRAACAWWAKQEQVQTRGRHETSAGA